MQKSKQSERVCLSSLTQACHGGAQSMVSSLHDPLEGHTQQKGLGDLDTSAPQQHVTHDSFI